MKKHGRVLLLLAVFPLLFLLFSCGGAKEPQSGTRKSNLIMDTVPPHTDAVTAKGGSDTTAVGGSGIAPSTVFVSGSGTDARPAEPVTEPIHEHLFPEFRAISLPDCTTAGKAESVCSCGERRESVLPPAGHSYGDWTETASSDCTNVGEETRLCSACGQADTRPIPALGHDFVLSVCRICGAKESFDGLFFRDNGDGTCAVSAAEEFDLEEVTVPSVSPYGSRVTAIADAAFQNCRTLVRVVLPETVETVGDYAFCSCAGLREVTLGNRLTRIGDYSFYGCKSMTSLTVPASVTHMGFACFCATPLSSLTIPFAGSDADGSGTAGLNYLFGMETLPANPNLFPKTLTSLTLTAAKKLDAAALMLTPLETVTLPASLTEIGSFAFRGSIGLETVYYDGSAEDWENVRKAPDWKSEAPDFSLIFLKTE